MRKKLLTIGRWLLVKNRCLCLCISLVVAPFIIQLILGPIHLMAQEKEQDPNCSDVVEKKNSQCFERKEFGAFSMLIPQGAVFEKVQGIHYQFWRYQKDGFKIKICDVGSGCIDIGEQERKMVDFIEIIETANGLKVRTFSWQNDVRDTPYKYSYGATYFVGSDPDRFLTIHIGSAECIEAEFTDKILLSVILIEKK